MPELPDITIYIEHLEQRVLNRKLQKIRLKSPFLLRSIDPKPQALEQLEIQALHRYGKRIVFELENEHFMVLHLMVAGRLQWKTKPGAAIQGRIGLAAFDFEEGTLLLTEASTKKRASLHLLQGREGLAAHDRGGLELFESTAKQFQRALSTRNHTLKRALTDPRIISGIGNAYSDEILHRAGLSPLKLSQSLNPQEHARLWKAARGVLQEWTERLREENKDGFPRKVTAFREEMAVHGRYRKPCPACNTKVQRIVYAENETNYCPRCQNEGRLLKDRSLSRLLKKDWPKTVDELENRSQT